MRQQTAIPNPNYREERVLENSPHEEQVRVNYAAHGWKLEWRFIDRAAPGHVRLAFRKEQL